MILGLELNLKSMAVDESCFEPAIKMTFVLKYQMNQEAPINMFGNVLFEKKSIGRLEPKVMPYFEFKIGPTDYNRNFGQKELEMELTLSLDKKIVSYMNDARKTSPKGDVNLTIDVNLTYLRNKAFVSYINEFHLNDATFPRDLKTVIEKNFSPHYYSDISVLLYTYPTQIGSYISNRTNLNLISSNGPGADDGYLSIINQNLKFEWSIKSSDWIHDFLPNLGLGEYEVIEIPRIRQSEALGDILKMLDEAKEKLYKSLDIGASLTSLRNSLTKFKEFVKGNGGLEELFKDNKNIIDLTDNLQKKLHGAASRSDDSTAAHASNGMKVEGYEAESMIFMAYALYKMVFDKIKSNNNGGGE